MIVPENFRLPWTFTTVVTREHLERTRPSTPPHLPSLDTVASPTDLTARRSHTVVDEWRLHVPYDKGVLVSVVRRSCVCGVYECSTCVPWVLTRTIDRPRISYGPVWDLRHERWGRDRDSTPTTRTRVGDTRSKSYCLGDGVQEQGNRDRIGVQFDECKDTLT